MKAILKQIRHRRHLMFLDLEGTQFSHEMIAFGAIKVSLKPDGSILRSYKGIKHYVISKGSIGSFVIKLTGITKDIISEKGISYADALKTIKNYAGQHYQKMAFVTFGTHDIRIFMQSLMHSNDADETIAKHIVKNHVDMSSVLGEFIRDDKNNPLSLLNYLKVFDHPFEGKAHDPLDDAKNLITLYKECFIKKDIIKLEYQKVLRQMRHLPEPVHTMLVRLLDGHTISSDEFDGLVKEYVG